MKKLLIISFCLVALSSCGTFSPLYNWGEDISDVTIYDQITYRNFKNQTPESICAMVVGYDGIVSEPGGTRGVVPPGVCAEYGYLLLQPDTPETFAKYATTKQKKVFRTTDYQSLFREKGLEMLNKEVELYPESSRFISPLIERLTK